MAEPEVLPPATLPPMRDSGGKFTKGHPRIAGGGRPVGAVTRITADLREQALRGYGNITGFVARLVETEPVAAAALLSRLLPPAKDPSEGGPGQVTEVTVVAVPSGSFVIADSEVPVR